MFEHCTTCLDGNCVSMNPFLYLDIDEDTESEIAFISDKK